VYYVVCFTDSSINVAVLPSVTREYHPKVLERLDLLQCISACLHRTLNSVRDEVKSATTGIDNLFRTADRFKPGIILRTGPQ